MKSHIYAKAYLGIALSLTGCMGVYEGGFECPPGEGVGYKSISEVNDMANQCSLQYSVFSTQCPECKVPELSTHNVKASDDSESVKLYDSYVSSLDIWYAPFSEQYSVPSAQKGSSQSIKPNSIRTGEVRERIDVTNSF